jgi:hypothetical protein
MAEMLSLSMMKKYVLVFFFLCSGCAFKSKSPTVHISLVNNGRSVEFKGLEGDILGEINRDSVPGIWENLIPVYRMPADTDLKDYQPVQHGLYQLKDSVVVFTPDTPFAKSRTYFLRYYQFGKGKSVWAFIKNKRRPGSVPPYVDFVFK